MKTYTARLTIREKGTNNKIKFTCKSLTEEAVNELEELFVREMILDPSRAVKQEMTEGLHQALVSLKSPQSGL